MFGGGLYEIVMDMYKILEASISSISEFRHFFIVFLLPFQTNHHLLPALEKQPPNLSPSPFDPTLHTILNTAPRMILKRSSQPYAENCSCSYSP